MFNTQLSDFLNFNYDSILFYKPDPSESTDKSPSQFKKIKIAVKNKDGTIGDLVFSTPPNLFSFGIQEIRDPTGQVTGYIMPITLWKNRQPTSEETAFQNVLHTVIDLSQECVENYVGHSIDVKRFNPLSIRVKKSESEQETSEPKAPVLYTKLVYNKRDDIISTVFLDEIENIEIQPLSLLSTRCIVKGAIKIDSIFIGDKITLQVKLYEALVRTVRTPRRRFLTIPTPKK